MHRTTIHRALVFLTMVTAGVGTRLYFRDLPNFAPVAALALFAGYYFASRAVALMVPLLVMTLSDLVIGGYEWKIMVLVYGSLALPVLWRSWLRDWFRFDGQRASDAAFAGAGLLTCGLASSLLFFLVTNFGSWMWTDMYAPTLSGLMRCYGQALPFFRNTLVGDLTFAALFFGGYAVAVRSSLARRGEMAAAG